MNAGGRPAKPAALHALAGTTRPDRQNSTQPMPAVALPLPPDWASPRAVMFWAEIGAVLLSLQVVSYADRTALTLLSEAYADWYELCLDVRENGRTYECPTEGGSVMYRPRPEVAMKSDAWRQVEKMLVHFGLTPASRSKVSKLGGILSDPADDIL